MVTVSLEHGNRKKYKTFEDALSALSQRFAHLTIVAKRTYEVREVLTTWFMVYNGKTAVGSIFEPCSLLITEHVEMLSYPRCELGERLFAGGPFREQNHGILEQ